MTRKRRRLQSEIDRDRRRITDLYLQGWLQADIAKELEISQSTVSRDLDALHEQWVKSALVNFDEAKAKELAKIDHLEREYWRAWQRSQEDAEATKIVESKDGKRYEAQTKGQAGDPRFLAGVQWCIDRRIKLIGLDEALKVTVQDWRTEIITLLRDGDVTVDDVRNALGPDLAREFFESAGVHLAGVGEAAQEGD